MTTTTLTNRIRRLIQDTENPYHWTDLELKSDIQSSIIELHKVRPETRYVDGRLTDAVVLPASATDVIAIDDRFEDAIVYHAAYMAYSDDCTDSVSKQLADDFLAKFNGFARQ